MCTRYMRTHTYIFKNWFVAQDGISVLIHTLYAQAMSKSFYLMVILFNWNCECARDCIWFPCPVSIVVYAHTTHLSTSGNIANHVRTSQYTLMLFSETKRNNIKSFHWKSVFLDAVRFVRCCPRTMYIICLTWILILVYFKMFSFWPWSRYVYKYIRIAIITPIWIYIYGACVFACCISTATKQLNCKRNVLIININ